MVKYYQFKESEVDKMDLCLDVGEYKLNIRAAGVIIHNNKVLLHKNVNKDHYAIPGGRIEIKDYMATIENFFEMDGKKYHELYFLYKAEFAEEEDKKIDYTIHNVEGKEYLQYEWADLNKIDEYNILPKCLKDILKMRQFPTHKINDELTIQ